MRFTSAHKEVHHEDRAPITALTPPSGNRGRTRAVQDGAPGTRAPMAGDRAEISPEASATRAAADAPGVARETRELVAQGNREAVASQPVDVDRLRALLRTGRGGREAPAPSDR